MERTILPKRGISENRALRKLRGLSLHHLQQERKDRSGVKYRSFTRENLANRRNTLRWIKRFPKASPEEVARAVKAVRAFYSKRWRVAFGWRGIGVHPLLRDEAAELNAALRAVAESDLR